MLKYLCSQKQLQQWGTEAFAAASLPWPSGSSKVDVLLKSWPLSACFVLSLIYSQNKCFSVKRLPFLHLLFISHSWGHLWAPGLTNKAKQLSKMLCSKWLLKGLRKDNGLKAGGDLNVGSLFRAGFHAAHRKQSGLCRLLSSKPGWMPSPALQRLMVGSPWVSYREKPAFY